MAGLLFFEGRTSKMSIYSIGFPPIEVRPSPVYHEQEWTGGCLEFLLY